MKKFKNVKIINKAAAIVLGVLITSNLAILHANAAFPNNNYTSGGVRVDGVALRSKPSTSTEIKANR